MIDREHLFIVVPGLTSGDLDQWIARAWVRPQETPDHLAFAEIDVARVRLLVSLRVELQIDAEAVPVVLSLVDQLYDHRRQLHLVRHAIEAADQREAVAKQMRRLVDE